MNDPVRQLADAVLYEGYILWPYRRSAVKNQQRWTFGGVFPPRHSKCHPDDRSEVKTEVVIDGSPDVEVRVRFLHVVERKLLDATGASGDELDGHLAWDEATEREVGPGPFRIRAGVEREELPHGAIVRSWRELRGRVDVRVADNRVTVVVANETPGTGVDREDALRESFCSTHVVLHAPRGRLVSATESEGDNVGLWPALIDDHTVLAAPIILSDHPQIAPESPGDLFDATEIDKLLILNVLALTPEEQDEMRATDPRAREILERCASLSPPELMRLHGTIRELRPVGGE